MAAQEDAAIEWRGRALAAEAEVLELRRRVEELEEENDLLAAAVAKARANETGRPTGGGVKAEEDLPGMEAYAALREHGLGWAVRETPTLTMKRATGGSNCLAVALCPGLENETRVAASGADGTVRLVDAQGVEVWSVALGAPAIVLRLHRNTLCAATMDGKTHLLNADDGSERAAYRDHGKFAVDAAWSPDGTLLATCGRDKTVVLYKRTALGGLEKKRSFTLPASPETACFSPDGLKLIVAARSEPFLRYIDVETLDETRVSINDRAADAHVSFDVLDLSASEDGFIAAATSKNQHVVYKLGDNRHARLLVGHASDDYANARLAWLQGSKSLVSNSSDSGALFQWDLASSKVMTKIHKAHAQPIRNLDVLHDRIATCSFDKVVNIWDLAAPESSDDFSAGAATVFS